MEYPVRLETISPSITLRSGTLRDVWGPRSRGLERILDG